MSQPYKQWITLFDSTEDDEFDGTLGEDDEEFPKIQCTITVLPDDLAANLSSRQASNSDYVQLSPQSKEASKSLISVHGEISENSELGGTALGSSKTQTQLFQQP